MRCEGGFEILNRFQAWQLRLKDQRLVRATPCESIQSLVFPQPQPVAVDRETFAFGNDKRGFPSVAVSFLSRDCCPSAPLNNEDCFVVNVVLFSNLPQMLVVFGGVFHQRIADVFC